MISVCLPTLNAIHFLKERMDSIFAQTYSDWELIVCDSYSTDGTWEFLQQFKSDPRVHLNLVPKDGLYAGWNECLRRTKGEYIHIATADDTCSPDFLRLLVSALSTNKKAELAFSSYSEIDENGMPLIGRLPAGYQYLNRWNGKIVRFPTSLCYAASCHFFPLWTTMSAVVFRSALVNKIGFFPVQFGSCGDLFWSLKAAASTDFLYVGSNLATWRRHSGQATLNQTQDSFHTASRKALDAAKAATSFQRRQLFGPSIKSDLALFKYQESLIMEMFGIDRGQLRNNPTRFFRGLIFSLWRHPLHCLRQCLALFPYAQSIPVAVSLRACCQALKLPEPEVLKHSEGCTSHDIASHNTK